MLVLQQHQVQSLHSDICRVVLQRINTFVSNSLNQVSDMSRFLYCLRSSVSEGIAEVFGC